MATNIVTLRLHQFPSGFVAALLDEIDVIAGLLLMFFSVLAALCLLVVVFCSWCFACLFVCFFSFVRFL